jgi:hypothetical protein
MQLILEGIMYCRLATAVGNYKLYYQATQTSIDDLAPEMTCVESPEMHWVEIPTSSVSTSNVLSFAAVWTSIRYRFFE